jgi:hypothetical protein
MEAKNVNKLGFAVVERKFPGHNFPPGSCLQEFSNRGGKIGG